MDYGALSAATVAALSPYVAEAAKELAKKAADSFWGNFRAVYELIKRRFAEDSSGSETLSRFEEAPDSPSRQIGLAAKLTEKLQADPSFAAELSQALRALQAASSQRITQSISISGAAGHVTQVGEVRGNLKIGSLSEESTKDTNDSKRPGS